MLIAIPAVRQSQSDSKILYINKKNAPILLQRDQNRFDLFKRTIINLKFSNNIIERTKLVYEYSNLIVNIISPEDIIILKCATDRAGDRLDAASIIKNTNINWNILSEEAINQMKLVGDVIHLSLYQFLLELKEDLQIEIPSDFLKKLERECEETLIKKLKQGKTVKVTRYRGFK